MCDKTYSLNLHARKCEHWLRAFRQGQIKWVGVIWILHAWKPTHVVNCGTIWRHSNVEKLASTRRCIFHFQVLWISFPDCSFWKVVLSMKRHINFILAIRGEDGLSFLKRTLKPLRRRKWEANGSQLGAQGPKNIIKHCARGNSDRMTEHCKLGFSFIGKNAQVDKLTAIWLP